MLRLRSINSIHDPPTDTAPIFVAVITYVSVTVIICIVTKIPFLVLPQLLFQQICVIVAVATATDPIVVA